MKNVTVSLPDEIYRTARIRAAEQDTSLSALVRDFLVQLGSGDSEFERKKRHQDQLIQAIHNRAAIADEFSTR